jgi:hypothetical protein
MALRSVPDPTPHGGTPPPPPNWNGGGTNQLCQTISFCIHRVTDGNLKCLFLIVGRRDDILVSLSFVSYSRLEKKVLSAGLVGGGGWWVALKTRETGQLLADCHLIRRNQIASGGSRLIIFCFFFLFQWEIVIKYIYLEIDKGYIYIHIEQLLFLSCMFLWRQIVAIACPDWNTENS